jgi:hypothetical protein
MPRDDLGGPAGDGAAEPADFERHLAIGEVTADLGDPLRGERLVGVVVDLAHDFLGVPCEPHLLVRVSGAQQAHQLVG